MGMVKSAGKTGNEGGHQCRDGSVNCLWRQSKDIKVRIREGRRSLATVRLEHLDEGQSLERHT